MVHIDRILDFELPAGQSAFLWGARKVGKSTFLRRKFPDSIVYDLLQTDLFLELSKKPSLLREQLMALDRDILRSPVILDEVQKVPKLLDEVHWLIENKGISFVLCGSSARKLRRGQVNLLGGRAWRFEMAPLVSYELQEVNLIRALNNGLIPTHYLQDDARRSLKAYTNDYLKEEIFAEGLARNIPAFSRFFDAMGYSHGELTNYSNIARDCGVDSKTVREYYQVLVDTLLGRFVEPYARRPGRQVITRAPKFYLFDVGVAGAITKRRIPEERGEQFGKALEHLILMELAAHSSYNELDYDIRFWRTKAGQEVDFVLAEGEVAIEVKGSSRIERRDFRGLKAFAEDHNPRLSIVVCTERRERILDDVRIMPWGMFIQRLWNGKIIS
ncbi:MAG: ATP-binding protein [bacterium]|nr:ATP-binding protein [bacterium]